MKTAKTINLDTATGILTIDGEPLGYRLADDDVTITGSTDGFKRVQITLLVEDEASIVGTPVRKPRYNGVNLVGSPPPQADIAIAVRREIDNAARVVRDGQSLMGMR